jgi:hypothetical protein
LLANKRYKHVFTRVPVTRVAVPAMDVVVLSTN